MLASESQLSFDVGHAWRDDGDGRQAPDLATFRVQGEFTSMKRQLKRGELVQVIVTDAAGEVIVSSYAHCRQVAFIDHEESQKAPAWTERAHRLKLAPMPGT